eukprot:gnl/TRDRNA2_/TRDRNA2_152649_c2_seq1.p1 gnl/TRDRNA2_/TRDRNA2_152649_c2~~gnl/TRDRNA2_/TRDRNA2_152649_c2_seq1.p1  ORF type:complete len:121 (+),score=5.19 gnl/TRDRNA2_/TRDRNA2_152649_c2_seq1:318-680(+)
MQTTGSSQKSNPAGYVNVEDEAFAARVGGRGIRRLLAAIKSQIPLARLQVVRVGADEAYADCWQQSKIKSCWLGCNNSYADGRQQLKINPAVDYNNIADEAFKVRGGCKIEYIHRVSLHV